MSSARRRRCAGCAPTSRGAVGADEHDGGVEEVPGEELEEVPGDGVGPVQVLDAHRDDSIGAEVADHLEDRDEQAAWPAIAGGRVRRGVEPPGERGEVLRFCEQVWAGASDLAEQVGERGERDDVAADGHAPPDVEVDAGSVGGFADQGRLADPGVAADEEDRGDTGLGVGEGAPE